MRSFSPSIFTRMVLFSVLLLSVWLFLLSRKENDRNRGIEAEIDRLKSQAEAMKEENATLREKILYFSSDAFQEREAKEKLGYRKSDERVLVFQGRPAEEGATELQRTVKESEEDQRSNPMKWMALFR